MWESSREPSKPPKYFLSRNRLRVSYADVIAAWRNDGEFRAFFNRLLAESEFTAFRWETPPVTFDTQQQLFEFVLLEAPELARRVEPDAFAEHFEADAHAVAFRNLRGDATLIVPCPRGPEEWYGHLATFVRSAPEEQIHSLWALVGEKLSERLGNDPIWLSTAGLGVSWLHLRLDSRPKYYVHEPYRRRGD